MLTMRYVYYFTVVEKGKQNVKKVKAMQPANCICTLRQSNRISSRLLVRNSSEMGRVNLNAWSTLQHFPH